MLIPGGHPETHSRQHHSRLGKQYLSITTLYHAKRNIHFFQAEDGIRDSVASRGLGDVYKRQHETIHLNPLPMGYSVNAVLVNYSSNKTYSAAFKVVLFKVSQPYGITLLCHI